MFTQTTRKRDLRDTLRALPAAAKAWGILAAIALSALGAGSAAEAGNYALPDAELNSADFGQLSAYSASSSTLDGRSDVPGPGVHFLVTLAGEEHGKLGIGDPWPTSPAAGFGWDEELHHDTSLAGYGGYEMHFTYVAGPAASDINVSLIMNTGLTGDSGNPPGDSTNDTFWAGPWTTVALGQAVTLTLSFDAAEAWNIADNKAPHTGGGLAWPDGHVYSVNTRDRNEVSNIGLQIADSDGDATGQQLTLHLNVPEPAAWSLLALAGAMMSIRAGRRVRAGRG